MRLTQAKKHDVLRRRELVADLYIQGHTQVAIAEKLSVKQPTVCQDLAAIRKLWRESTIRNFDEAKDLELQKLDRVEREAWSAWERSQKPAQSATVEGDGAPKRSRKTIVQKNGDPRYLDTVLKCVAARRAILGLDAPTKIAPVTPDGQPLTFDQRQVHINAILAERFGLHVLGVSTDEHDASSPSRSLGAAGVVIDALGCGTPATEPAQCESSEHSADEEAAPTPSGVPAADL